MATVDLEKEGATTFRKLSIPPIFGRPKQKNVAITKSPRPSLWLVAVDDPQLKAIRIQTIPMEMEVDPQPNWAVIPSIGRNNPFYNYTGAEDTLRFTLDWYSVVEDRSDVITACRWVEGLSRSDGYKRGPSRVKLIMGALFTKDIWIVKSAPYKLSLFDTEKAILPRQAYQDLTLNKVSGHNLTRDEIRFDR